MPVDASRATRLRDLMTHRRTSPAEVAEAANVSISTVSQWRNGHDIRSTHLVLLAELLNTSIDYLLIGHTQSYTPEENELIDLLRNQRPEVFKTLIEFVKSFNPR